MIKQLWLNWAPLTSKQVSTCFNRLEIKIWNFHGLFFYEGFIHWQITLKLKSGKLNYFFWKDNAFDKIEMIQLSTSLNKQLNLRLRRLVIKKHKIVYGKCIFSEKYCFLSVNNNRESLNLINKIKYSLNVN